MGKLVLFCCILSCALLPSRHALTSPIKVGVIYALSGPAQHWGNYGAMGLRLAQEDLRERGIHFELIFEDSGTEPAGSVAAYHKLTAAGDVKIIISNVWGYLTLPLIPLVEKDGGILFSPTFMKEAAPSNNKSFFSMGQSISSINGAINRFFEVNPRVGSIGIVCWDDYWGRSYINFLREISTARKIKVTNTFCTTDYTHDYRTDILKITSSGAQAIFFSAFATTILRRLNERKFSGAILTSSNILEDLQEGGIASSLYDGVYYIDWDAGEDFRNRFKIRFGKKPILEAHNSYEVLRTLAKALQQKDTDLQQGLKTVSYQGSAGLIDFRTSNFGNLSQASLFQIKGGATQLVGVPEK